MRTIIAFFALALLAACQPQDPITFTDPSYRPPLGDSGIGVGFVVVRSAKDDRIVGVSSPQADAVEIHATVNEGGRSRMKRQETVDLPAGQDVAFAEGGMHLMVINPRPIAPVPDNKAAQATFPVEFKLESGSTKVIAFRVGTGASARN